MQNKLKCHQAPTQLLLWQCSLKNWNFAVLLLIGHYVWCLKMNSYGICKITIDAQWLSCWWIRMMVQLCQQAWHAQHSCIMPSSFWKGHNIHVRESVSSGLAYWEVLVTTKHVVQKNVSSPNKVIGNSRGLGVSKNQNFKGKCKAKLEFLKGCGEVWIFSRTPHKLPVFKQFSWFSVVLLLFFNSSHVWVSLRSIVCCQETMMLQVRGKVVLTPKSFPPHFSEFFLFF